MQLHPQPHPVGTGCLRVLAGMCRGWRALDDLFMSPEAGPVVPSEGGDWTRVTCLISGLVSSRKLCCKARPLSYLAHFNEA